MILQAPRCDQRAGRDEVDDEGRDRLRADQGARADRRDPRVREEPRPGLGGQVRLQRGDCGPQLRVREPAEPGQVPGKYGLLIAR